MRVHDLAKPAIPAHTIPPDQPSAGWPATPIIGLEYLPAGDVWDDIDAETVVWDAEPTLVWDDPDTAAGFTDVWCDVTGAEIVNGEPDEAELFPPGRVTLTLYDPTGKYRRRTPDGRLTFYAPGRRVAIGAEISGVWWWLFYGRVATWHELPDAFIEIVAYTCTAALAQDPGRDWSAGVAGEQLGARAAAIVANAALAGVVLRAATGTNTLAKPPAERVAWLERLQQAAWSDGGVVYADADDTLRVTDRTWRYGRDDSPAAPLVLTDNVCHAGAVVVWSPQLAFDDDWLAARVVLTNLADLVAVASNPTELIDPNAIFTHPDRDVWDTQLGGDTLAAFIATLRGTNTLAVAFAAVHLHDSRFDYWQRMIDCRIGDRVGWLHTELWPDGTLEEIDVDVIVHTIRHAITPETWTVEIETTPAIGYRVAELWNTTARTWDDTAPEAIWR